LINRLDGKGEGDSPGGNLLLQAVDLVNLAGCNLCLEVLELVGLLGQLGLDLLAQLDACVDVVGNLLEVFLAETSRCHGRCTNADTHGCQSRLVAGCGVLVAGNVDLFENGLDTCAVKGKGLEVDEDHVVVCAVGDELEAKLVECCLELLGVLDNLLLVELEVLGLCLLERDSKRSDGVVVGSTLVTWEDREVDGSLKVVQCLLARLRVGLPHTLAEKDHGATRSTKRLVGGGGYEIAVWEGRLVHASSDESGNMCHIHHQVASDLVGNLAHTGVVNLTAVGRSTGYEDLGAVHERILLKLVVVDKAGVEVYAVREGLEVSGDSRDSVKG
jgi:hypothetical protein